MGYRGETAVIPFDKGGLVYNPNLDTVEPSSMLHPSRNINMHQNGRQPRGGTSIVLSDSGRSDEIRGIYDFQLRSGTRFTINADANGDLYKNADTTIKTGLSTSNYFAFETYNNELYVFDGEHVPQTWDGSAAATSDLTTPPSDWTGTNYPQWAFNHGKGNSRRMIAGGCASNPHRFYISSNTDAKDFGDSNGLQINVETGDGFGIVGGLTFGDRAILFGKTKTYLLDDSDSTPANWGYKQAQFNAGIAHWRLVAKTANDIVAMSEDGEIYSVTAAENYGDYKLASLTRPSWIHEYIKTYIDLAYIDKFHMCYDPMLRAIKIFVVRDGQTSPDTALVLFFDKGPEQGWIVHDNQDNASGYSATASAVVRPSTGVWKVYTGDTSGRVWELETTSYNDNGAAYYKGFRTPNMSFGDPRRTKMFRRGLIACRPEGDWDLSINVWIDGDPVDAATVNLGSSGDVLGSFVLGTSILGGDAFIDGVWDIGKTGKRVQFEFYNSAADEDFYLSQLMVDYKPLGKLAG